MHISGHLIAILSADEVSTIHINALRILEEMGMEIQHTDLLTVLAQAGLPINLEKMRVCFPRSFVEQFLANADHYDWDWAQPTLSVSAGVYEVSITTHRQAIWNPGRRPA